MKATILKILASVLATALAQIGPKLLGMAATRLKTLNSPSVKGLMTSHEFEQLLMKATGYSSIPALAIAALTYFAAHDGEFIKNGLIAGTLSWIALVAAKGIKLGNSGPESDSILSPKAVQFLASQSCPAGECKFTGSIVEPAAPLPQ